MGHWNHRVIRREHETPCSGEPNEVTFAIHETYYDSDGVPKMISDEPDGVVSEDVDGLRKTLTWMLACLDKPVLEYEQFDTDAQQQ